MLAWALGSESFSSILRWTTFLCTPCIHTMTWSSLCKSFFFCFHMIWQKCCKIPPLCLDSAFHAWSFGSFAKILSDRCFFLQVYSSNPARPLHSRIRSSRCHQIFLQRWASGCEEHLRQIPSARLPRGDLIHWNVARRPEVILLFRSQLIPCTCWSDFFVHQNDFVL